MASEVFMHSFHNSNLYRRPIKSANPNGAKEEKAKATSAKEKVKPNPVEFTTIIAEYYKAWNTLDLQKPAKYYDKDPNLVFYDIAPLQYKG
jgi:hypothetical protein